KLDPAREKYRNGLAQCLLRSGQISGSSGHVGRAAAEWRRAISIYEGARTRSGASAVPEAGCHAMLSRVAGLAGSGIPTSDSSREAERAIGLLREAVSEGYLSYIPGNERALDSIRSRPDFQLLIMDLAVPADPFAR